MLSPTEIIYKPVFSEKASKLQESGGNFIVPEDDDYAHKYVFEVAIGANKVQIRQAVEKLFDVKVRDVRTLVQRGKRRTIRTRVGILSGAKKTKKKAIVTLVAGDTIELFEGV